MDPVTYNFGENTPWMLATILLYCFFCVHFDDLISIAHILISWFFLILCSHRCYFFNERAMCSPEK